MRFFYILLASTGLMTMVLGLMLLAETHSELLYDTGPRWYAEPQTNNTLVVDYWAGTNLIDSALLLVRDGRIVILNQFTDLRLPKTFTDGSTR